MNDEDVIVYTEVSDWEWTKKQMEDYIRDNIYDISLKTGKQIKVNTYKKIKSRFKKHNYKYIRTKLLIRRK